jgi:flagellar biosynthesis/type III secretory pathway protein FliH
MTSEQREQERRLQQLMKQAARLVEDLAAQAERAQRIDRAAFAEGYRLGFAAGQDVGYGRAHHEMAAEWEQLARRIRQSARRPTFAELQARRAIPATPNSPSRSSQPPGRAA